MPMTVLCCIVFLGGTVQTHALAPMQYPCQVSWVYAEPMPCKNHANYPGY